MSTQEQLMNLVNEGFDVVRNDLHLYKRGKAFNIVKFAEQGVESVIDERHETAEKAVSRYLEILPTLTNGK